MPDTWLDVARDAREAANRLVTEDHYRSAVSRAYYAAYSKVTYELVATAGLPMPPDREGPSHGRIRPVIQSSMPNMVEEKRDKHYQKCSGDFTLSELTRITIPPSMLEEPKRAKRSRL